MPIPGTQRRTYLEDNLGAAAVTLDDTQMAVLDEALSPSKIAGPRYSPTQASLVDR